ncbi:MAG TPA: MobQ family relaxase [Terriglobia bacterium]
MAIYHCSTKPLARSSGRSAVAAAAYRSGDCLIDERQGLEHDYTRRSGVLHTKLVLPEGAGQWTRAELWNAAEKAEKRKDARTAREWEVALPDELGEDERRELAVRFAAGLANRYGCAVDVALHAPDREGDHRNWHAHLLATTRKVTAGALAEKCEIELSDAKRLSLGLAPARIEVESVRQMWAQEVNRQLIGARRPERVDHRSIAAQREEAIQKGQAEKAAELDRAPQVKLGWKVIQMVRRALFSDRADQLRQVHADNAQRKAVVLDIGQLRNQLAQRQEEEALRRRQAEQKKHLEEVEAVFHGQGPLHRESTLKRWRHLATRDVPDVQNARAIWEQDQWDPDAKAWRETWKTVEWETDQAARSAAAVEDWHRKHPVQGLVVRTGLKKPSADLRRLEQTHAESIRFLEGSQRRLAELEQAWPKKRLVYQRQLEREGEEIRKAKQCLGVIEQHLEHFQKFWAREDQERVHERRQHDRGRGGWSR